MELMVVARLTMTNPGRSAQNDAPRLQPSPGHAFEGIPIQDASTAGPKS